MNIDAFVPKDYFNNDYERIQLYKNIDKVENFLELKQLKEETIDKTSKLPNSINLLFEKKKIDLYIKENVIENFEESNDKIILVIGKNFLKYHNVGIKIFDIASKISNTIILNYRVNVIKCTIPKKDNWFKIMLEFVENLDKLKKTYEGTLI